MRGSMARSVPHVDESEPEPESWHVRSPCTYLAGALKAPRITDATFRLADQARDAGWTHEDYLAGFLEREFAARGASGAQLRIRAAGFSAVKTLKDFDFGGQPAGRQQVGALASGAFLTEARTWSSSARQEPARRIWPLRSEAPKPATGSVS